MRGQKQYGSNSSIEFAVAELYGGIKQQIIYFAAETGVSASWVAERVSTLLSPPGERLPHHMPTMQLETTGARGAVEPLEVVVNAHSGEAPVAVEAKRTNSKIAEYWAKMTPAQRAAEMVRRLNKRGNKTMAQKRAIKSLKAISAGKAPLKKKSPSDDPEIRKYYNARHTAKKAGKPLPPLPSELGKLKTVGRPTEQSKVKIGANGQVYPLKTPEQKRAERKRQLERYEAKKRGLPLPPLLSQERASLTG